MKKSPPSRRSSPDSRDSRDSDRPVRGGRRPWTPPAADRGEMVLRHFAELWGELFSSPVHLDSAISKRPGPFKSALARISTHILLRPASAAEALGIGVSPGEPWSLSMEGIAKWRPAVLLSKRLYEMMTGALPEALPVEGDFPEAMVKEWTAAWGEKGATALIHALGKEPPLSLRASRKFGAAKLLKELTQDSSLPVSVQLSSISPLGVRLSGYAPVMGLEAYEKGGFEIQDEGSQLMALFALWPERFASILQKAPGPVRKLSQALELPEIPAAWRTRTFVDACAGAGGKSLAFADILGNRGRIYAYDTSPKKLQALRRRATRAGLTNIQSVPVEEGAEAKVVDRFKDTADVVLVDAPCSGWGVLRRNPDIKWRQRPDTLTRMPEIQVRLLGEYSRLVRPGGTLVFGVCTFREAETRDVVRRFLTEHREFEAREGGYLGPDPCDGFFMQAFRRSGG